MKGYKKNEEEEREEGEGGMDTMTLDYTPDNAYIPNTPDINNVPNIFDTNSRNHFSAFITLIPQIARITSQTHDSGLLQGFQLCLVCIHLRN